MGDAQKVAGCVYVCVYAAVCACVRARSASLPIEQEYKQEIDSFLYPVFMPELRCRSSVSVRCVVPCGVGGDYELVMSFGMPLMIQSTKFNAALTAFFETTSLSTSLSSLSIMVTGMRTLGLI